MFKISKLDVHRNPFIGLYLAASDDNLLYSPFVLDKLVSIIIDILKPKRVCRTGVAESHLTGLYTVMNSNGAVLPNLAEDIEVKRVKQELGINVCRIDDRFSAVLNNVLVNDNACVVNPHLPREEQRKISDCLGVEVFSSKLSIPTVGSVNVVTNSGLLGYNNAKESELQWLSRMLKVKFNRATSNFGTISTAYGVVANSNGCLAGSLSTGFEMGAMYQALSG